MGSPSRTETLLYTEVKAEKTVVKKMKLTPSVQQFLDQWGKIESQGNYQIKSTTGYLGKYQFSPRTIKGLGFVTTEEHFLANPELQDSVAVAWIKFSEKVLHGHIECYEGQVIDSILITKAGLLAGSCLVGPGGVMSFLQQDTIHPTIDGNNISVKKYIRIFSQYQLQGI